MAISFNPENEKRLQDLLAKYPTKQSALLPALYLVQDQEGWVSPEAMEFLAGRLALSAAYVESVACFYTMYNKKPVGKYHVQVCTNVSCLIVGAPTIVDRLKTRLGLEFGETTADGKFTLTEVECLGACGTAPAMQINDDYYENLTPSAVDEILDRLK